MFMLTTTATTTTTMNLIVNDGNVDDGDGFLLTIIIDYDDLIKKSFSEAIESQEIRILCLFENEISIFAGSQDFKNIREKIQRIKKSSKLNENKYGC